MWSGITPRFAPRSWDARPGARRAVQLAKQASCNNAVRPNPPVQIGEVITDHILSRPAWWHGCTLHVGRTLPGTTAQSAPERLSSWRARTSQRPGAPCKRFNRGRSAVNHWASNIEPRFLSWTRPSGPLAARLGRRDDDAGYCPLGGATPPGAMPAVQSGA